jgi:hypothetical protein
MYELEWRIDVDHDAGRWKRFDTAEKLRSFVADGLGGQTPIAGELRLRSVGPADGTWEVITTVKGIERWHGSSPPPQLLASRWMTERAADASVGHHVQRLRILLSRAVSDGLIDERQRERIVDVFEEAVVGEGIAGRTYKPITDRPADIGHGGPTCST